MTGTDPDAVAAWAALARDGSALGPAAASYERTQRAWEAEPAAYREREEP